MEEEAEAEEAGRGRGPGREGEGSSCGAWEGAEDEGTGGGADDPDPAMGSSSVGSVIVVVVVSTSARLDRAESRTWNRRDGGPVVLVPPLAGSHRRSCALPTVRPRSVSFNAPETFLSCRKTAGGTFCRGQGRSCHAEVQAVDRSFFGRRPSPTKHAGAARLRAGGQAGDELRHTRPRVEGVGGRRSGGRRRRGPRGCQVVGRRGWERSGRRGSRLGSAREHLESSRVESGGRSVEVDEGSRSEVEGRKFGRKSKSRLFPSVPTPNLSFPFPGFSYNSDQRTVPSSCCRWLARPRRSYSPVPF